MDRPLLPSGRPKAARRAGRSPLRTRECRIAAHGPGEPEAHDVRLHELAAAHRAALHAFALRLVDGDAGSADDVVQETFIRAWQHPEAFLPGRGSPRGWLFRVAHNLAMDTHRARARRAEISDTAIPEAAAADFVETTLVRHEVDRALTALSPDHRQVITEVYLQGRVLADVAERLGIPVGTIKSRSHHALRRLSLILHERGLGPVGTGG